MCIRSVRTAGISICKPNETQHLCLNILNIKLNLTFNLMLNLGKNKIFFLVLHKRFEAVWVTPPSLVGGGYLARGNQELWEEQLPTPRRRDTHRSNTNSPPLRKERTLFLGLYQICKILSLSLIHCCVTAAHLVLTKLGKKSHSSWRFSSFLKIADSEPIYSNKLVLLWIHQNNWDTSS